MRILNLVGLIAAVLAGMLIGAYVHSPIARADLSPSAFPAPASSAKVIATATVTPVKATAGILRRVTVTTQIASATIKFFDLAAASCTGTPSTNPQAVITLPSTIGIPFTLEFGYAFVNGICVLPSGATNFTVIYD